MRLLPASIIAFLLSSTYSLQAIAQSPSPICKTGTAQVKVLADTCYDYQTNTSSKCPSDFKPDSYKAVYEYYIYDKNGKIINTATKTIPHNVVTSICTDTLYKGEKPYAVITTRYGGGFTYTTIPEASSNLIIQPIVDPTHPGSNAIFCKNNFTAGSKSDFCPLSDANNLIK